ncbi:MAG TPA: hypothetical protein VGN44_13225 [Candidatus Angelobacter sp.]|jgi:hypothetical protein
MRLASNQSSQKNKHHILQAYDGRLKQLRNVSRFTRHPIRAGSTKLALSFLSWEPLRPFEMERGFSVTGSSKMAAIGRSFWLSVVSDNRTVCQ